MSSGLKKGDFKVEHHEAKCELWCFGCKYADSRGDHLDECADCPVAPAVEWEAQFAQLKTCGLLAEKYKG